MKRIIWVLMSCVLAAAPVVAADEVLGEREQKIQDAVTIIEEIAKIPEKGVPDNLFGRAAGIAIIPGMVKAGLVVGGKHGTGVMCTRQEDGWSNPVFVKVTGGSIGWQIGAQSTDLILLFMRKKNIDNIIDGEFTVGADASVAAGPVGRSAGAGTSADLEAEIYSYSRSRGAFAGLSIEGSKLRIDKDANTEFYKVKGITPEQIIYGAELKAPEIAGRLIAALADYSTKTDEGSGE